MSNPYGGQAPRRPDQYVPVSPAGIQPGTATGVVRARQVIVFGVGEGVFVYNGTPALGNPPILTLSDSTTDPFGNAIQPGIVAYSGSTWAQLLSGTLNFSNGSFISSGVSGGLSFITSGTPSIVMNANTNEIDLNAGSIFANGNSVGGLFGNLDPSGLPLSGSATLAAVIAAVNSMFSRFQVMGVFQ